MAATALLGSISADNIFGYTSQFWGTFLSSIGIFVAAVGTGRSATEQAKKDLNENIISPEVKLLGQGGKFVVDSLSDATPSLTPPPPPPPPPPLLLREGADVTPSTL
uniref:Uncharacterized protein n=1 Tax=Haptolina brevifila TaxID=156173 RepID=A0A7S2DHB3_9EUKA